ncbi:MAG: hypothetical protein ACRC7S_16650 [Cetobacterium sp.]
MILTILAVIIAFTGQLFETNWADTSLVVALVLIALSIIWRRKEIF